MQKHLYILFLIVSIAWSFLSNAQIIYIPDVNFKNKLIQIGVDGNNNGEIEEDEAIKWGTLTINGANISDLTGINAFKNLTDLWCWDNQLTTLDLRALTNLKSILLNNNHISKLDIAGLINLIELDCSYNELNAIDLNGLTGLQILNIDQNKLSSLALTAVPNLQKLFCGNNELNTIDLKGLINLQELIIGNNKLSSLLLTEVPNLEVLSCDNNQLTSIDVSGLSKLVTFYCGDNLLQGLEIIDLKNLKKLWCYNNLLSSINLIGLNALEQLWCYKNRFETLSINNLPILKEINCSNNNLISFHLFNLPKLTNISCYDNQLEDIDLSNLKSLQYINFQYNQLKSIHIDSLTSLITLYCDHNQIGEIDFSKLTSVRDIFCQYNNLKIIDVSTLTSLHYLACNNNSITALFLKNNSYENVDFSANPVQFVCCDDWQIIDLQKQAIQYKLFTCSISSYCSFTPGGIFYTVEGQNTYDLDNNECDSLDPIIPLLKFKVTGGTNTGNFISDISGHYIIPLQAGAYTIKPLLEHPSYFTVNPDSLQVNFPNNTSPFSQDFCISPLGIHADVEIKIIPFWIARPGFEALYKLVFHNKGNTSVSGQIQFYYSEDLMDFINASSTPLTQNSGSLVWNFMNLDPFQTASILIKMKINSPTDNLPVNVGDELVFYANIDPNAIDELPVDNKFTLHQTVVGYKDPNDKRCLQGNYISRSMIGNYIDYLIRFENTGTANAINIVVKDIIDTSKFDINSLIPVDASHLFRTIISEGNKVEFIFEHINLPFIGDNNNGYVAFKIRTKSNLKIGDKLKNTADIYFDYNLLVSTNEVVTGIQLHVNVIDEVNGNSKISIVPNPANQFVYIQSSEKIIRLEIFDADSRLIESHIAPGKKFDISQLTSGLYWLRCHTDKGIATTELVKN